MTTENSPSRSSESGRVSSPDLAAARGVNKILDDVLYGTYGVNSTSVEVHGALCEALIPLIAPARVQADASASQGQP